MMQFKLEGQNHGADCELVEAAGGETAPAAD